jgi:hypothetical protein
MSCKLYDKDPVWVVMNRAKELGWTLLIDWKLEKKGILKYNAVREERDETGDWVVVEDIDIFDFVKSLERDKKLGDLGL